MCLHPVAQSREKKGVRWRERERDDEIINILLLCTSPAWPAVVFFGGGFSPSMLRSLSCCSQAEVPHHHFLYIMHAKFGERRSWWQDPVQFL